MTQSAHWHRALVPSASADGERLPAIAALATDLPTTWELFEFMRDAELRFASLRMRVIERSHTTRGEDATRIEVVLRHPGHSKVTTTREDQGAKGDYEIWISDGDLVRTYASAHRLGTQRPIRNRPRGLHDRDFPGRSQVYEPLTPLPMETLPETFVHPAGFCQNVLSSGRCWVAGSELVSGREAVLLECDHPRTTEAVADRPDYHISIAVDRETGVILRFVEAIGGEATRHAEVVDFEPDAPLPPSAFQFVFPSGTTMLY
jgi:outer membrane lipoprotein-sorting protein